MKPSDVRRDRELRRRAGYRELIIHAAERVIIRKGYSATTMDDVAREAQLSKATVYKYISGKGALLFEILSHYFDDLRLRLETILAGPENSCEKLRLSVRLILQDHEDKKNLSRVLWMDKAMLKLMRVFAATSGKPGSAPAADRKMIGLFREKRQELTAVGAKILDEGVASGELRRMDTGLASAFIEAVLEGYAHDLIWRSRAPVSPDAADALTRFILDGIRNRDHSLKEN